MSRTDDRIRLQHMLDAVSKASQLTFTRTRADLDCDDTLALALVRLLEIIGEAAKNVSSNSKEQMPDIPWRQIGATRDRLIHGYLDVDLDIVWEICSSDLPPLQRRLQEFLSASP